MTLQQGWKVDVNQCISCRSCEMACKVEFGLQAGQGRRRRVIEKTVVEGSTVRTFFLSLACNHCEKPACIAACASTTDSATGETTSLPLGAPGNSPSRSALYKDDGTYTSAATAGVVMVNPNRCIGCRRCEWACPYGAPQWNPETKKIHKCELCWQRVKNTRLHQSRRVPACQASCMGKSIFLDEVDTNPTATDADVFDIELNATSGSLTPAFRGAGSTGDGFADRGTQYVADGNLTRPALKIRNRVYVKRDGGVE